MTTSEDEKPKLTPTKILKCRNPECKAWVRDEFTVADMVCPLCKGPMIRSIKHLAPVQNKIKRQPRKKKDEFDF